MIGLLFCFSSNFDETCWICWIFTKFHQIGWFSFLYLIAQNLSIRLLLGHRRQVNSAISLHGKNFCGFIYAPAIFLAKLDFYEKTWYSYFLVEQHLGCSLYYFICMHYCTISYYRVYHLHLILLFVFSFQKMFINPVKKNLFFKNKNMFGIFN